MLHSANPASYMSSEQLSEAAVCPDCGARAELSVGVVHLGHYSFDGQVLTGLIWTCSDQCFLSWEHRSFMAAC
jgi:hypothetical protein